MRDASSFAIVFREYGTDLDKVAPANLPNLLNG